MKRNLCAAFAAALLMPGLCAVNSRAQDGEPAPSEQSERPAAGRQDGAAMAARMKARLGLTDDQAVKLRDAMKGHGAAMKPLFSQARKTAQKLAEQVRAQASDSDITASLDALKAAHKAIAEEETRFRDGLASFLTPTQRAKMALDAMRRMRRARGATGPRRQGPPDGGQPAPTGGDDAGE